MRDLLSIIVLCSLISCNSNTTYNNNACTITSTDVDVTIDCGNTIETIIKPTNGMNGKDGVDGTNGEGCIVLSNPDGAVVSCGDSSVLIHHGKDGLNGEDNILNIIHPCENSKEILLQLNDGSILAFYQGKEGYIALLPDGKYRTTDGTSCIFEIKEGEII